MEIKKISTPFIIANQIAKSLVESDFGIGFTKTSATSFELDF